MDFDLGLLGFSKDELAKLLDPGVKEGLTDPDEMPEPPDEAITKPGDLWILGDHRLLCGDSSKPEDVDRLLAGATIQLVNTDPPYNVDVEPRTNNAMGLGERRGMPRPELAEAFGGWNLHERRRGSASRRPTQDAGPATGRWRTTSSPTRSSTALLARLVRQHRPRAGARPRASTSGAGMPTAATTRRC